MLFEQPPVVIHLQMSEKQKLELAWIGMGNLLSLKPRRTRRPRHAIPGRAT